MVKGFLISIYPLFLLFFIFQFVITQKPIAHCVVIIGVMGDRNILRIFTASWYLSSINAMRALRSKAPLCRRSSVLVWPYSTSPMHICLAQNKHRPNSHAQANIRVQRQNTGCDFFRQWISSVSDGDFMARFSHIRLRFISSAFEPYFPQSNNLPERMRYAPRLR